jgi:mycofactocin precursor
MPTDPETTLATAAAPDADSDAATQVEVEELLVEEVSIDGLCGVY